MLYSAYAILAIMLLIIVNFDVLIKNDYSESITVIHAYRLYLYGILIFYTSDCLWGILYEYKFITLCYIDTVFYFISMIFAVFLWTRFVVLYLKRDDIFEKILKILGCFLLITQITILIWNQFAPVMFRFSEDGTFKALPLRYAQLYAQIALYFITSVYSLFWGWRNTKFRHRYRTIGMVGIFVSVSLLVQALNPLLPFSSMGYMLGSSLLHTFVLDDEKREQHDELLTLLERERCQRKELEQARKMAYVDSLTGVRNKYAYFKLEQQIDDRISNKLIEQLAVIVFDLNNLKIVNDHFGHKAGDQYIKEGCRLICTTFKHSPVFRVGGDEFVAILEGEDYENREELLRSFNEVIDYNNCHDAVVVASGLEEYRPQTDYCYQLIFERADKKMYERKMQLKGEMES